jgi:hypothetical protein
MSRKNKGLVTAAIEAIFAMSLLMSAAVYAQNATLAGKWIFTGQYPRENTKATATTDGIVIEQNGAAIRGTLTVPRGGTSSLEGTVEDNQVRFAVRRQTRAGEVILDYRGVVAGDSMKGTYRVRGQVGGTDIHWFAAREKDS